MSIRRTILFASAIAVLVGSVVSCELASQVSSGPEQAPPSRPVLIAHAGGGIHGGSYSNAREAFDLSYANGHRYFEADFCWTSDGRLVLVHDWEDSFREWFLDAGEQPSLEEFKALRMREGLTQMTLSDLYVWMLEHDDAYLVTDVKERNLDALRLIAKTSQALKERFIPQVYRLGQFFQARDLGFRDVILTLYRIEETPESVFDFATEQNLFAVTMPPQRALGNSYAERLTKRGVFVYVHTINSLDKWDELQRQGVTGIYTDFITPANISKSVTTR